MLLQALECHPDNYSMIIVEAVIRISDVSNDAESYAVMVGDLVVCSF